ncbi:hypothetical protein JHN55_10195 [Streptomyces sp. MBT56]|uniref:hypothetical protein n=1 Tax=unclassified Streptomyces TaxID=2593676 RepID=UPI00190CE3CE|nr:MULTISPECIES: hypothetical protein [unclassified Streptomyces]MBK3556892.1 hypothetical protein [Streptomyces sp. MBT56]MBK3605681.1 hypothetical protein [Streptomyces sp. MBT54]MBK3618820.1 hypothetical protein [Streptomyces sp. MBT98]MBK6047012.1 hypothetical protein [Streptomyces sp. MBT55]
MNVASPALGLGVPVAEYGTGLQVTRVHRAPDGDLGGAGDFLWWHGPGPGRGGPLRVPARSAALVPDLGPAEGAALLATGTPYGDGLLHRAAGSASAAAWLRDPRPQAGRLVAHSLAAAARALRALHGVSLPPGPQPLPPPGVRRLREWAAGTGPLAPAAARLRRRAREVWGESRTERLLGWADDAVRASGTGAPVVPLHGWASTGSLVPPRSRGRVALLTGEDLGAGRRELDLGWMLGDLVELAWSSPLHRAAAESPGLLSVTDLQRVFLGAYEADGSDTDRREGGGHDAGVREDGDHGPAGPVYDPVAVGRCAVLRVVTHMRDFATYCEWSDELLDYLAFTAELIDEEGRRAVPRGVS